VQIDYFFEAGCPTCAAVDGEVLPALEGSYAGLYELNRWDINVESNYLRLVAVQDHFRVRDDAPVSIIVDRQTVLLGLPAIRERLLGQVALAIDARLQAEAAGRVYTLPPAIGAAAKDAVQARAAAFTWYLATLSGLTDGLNPCAFTTIVFLVTLLGTGGRKGWSVLLGGMAFCVASFATYLLIGLGLLAFLRELEGMKVARAMLEWGMVALLLLLAFLSLRDAWRYGRTGDAHAVTLQLPEGIKRRIRTFARARWHGPAVFGTGLVCGAGVTVLESVCTGQLYLPALAMMSREGGRRATGLLLLYNAMFVVPLFAVFVLGALGVRNQRLVDWTRRHVVPSKLLLAGVFVALAVVMWPSHVGP
jgi:hypothetical protein